MLKRHLLACLVLAGFGLSAHAQEAPQKAPEARPGHERCADDPLLKERFKERHEAFCKDNPQRCEELKAKREEMRQQCKQDPAACEKRHEEMRAKFKERLEERCKANPERCEAMKKRFEARHPASPSNPAPAPAAQ